MGDDIKSCISHNKDYMLTLSLKELYVCMYVCMYIYIYI